MSRNSRIQSVFSIKFPHWFVILKHIRISCRNQLQKGRDNMNYAMKVYPMHLENGKTEWCVEYPDLKGCVGGGDTIEEAIADAQATKSVYLSYLKDEGIELPVPKDEGSLPSGKIALRVPKTTHKQLLENAQMDGVSLNTYIKYSY